MAAITPTTVYQESLGSVKLIIANFPATVDTGDIWTSNIKGIVSVMGCQADAPGTQGSTGAGAAVTTQSTGAITLYIGEDNSLVTVWVLAKS